MDSLIVPFKKSKTDSSKHDYDLEFFQEENWNLLPEVAFMADDGLFYWITLPSMDSSVQIYRSTTEIDNGETKLLDGKIHHYSLAIHKRHLSIVIDGNVVHSTDLKLSEKFYG